MSDKKTYVQRSKHGNILFPIHQIPTEFVIQGNVDIIRCISHISNQIYELHQSMFGWEEEETPEEEHEGRKREEPRQTGNYRETPTPSSPSKSPEPQ